MTSFMTIFPPIAIATQQFQDWSKNCIPFRSTWIWVHVSFSGVGVAGYLVFCVVFFLDDCLSFCPFSFCHFIVCLSIYGFYYNFWYLRNFIWFFYDQHDYKTLLRHQSTGCTSPFLYRPDQFLIIFVWGIDAHGFRYSYTFVEVITRKCKWYVSSIRLDLTKTRGFILTTEPTFIQVEPCNDPSW